MQTEEQKQHNKEQREKLAKKRTKNSIIIAVSLVLLAFLIRPMIGLIGVNIHYGSGERIVKVIKLSEQGLIWKTWEVEGVLTQGNFSVTYVWDFSVDNWDPNKEKLVIDLKTAFETGQTVKISYEQMAGSVPWRSHTAYFVKEIRFR